MIISKLDLTYISIDAHRGVRGGYETAPPPRQIFKKLANKNAIKPKIGGPPR
jgi:hypothetical protein